MARKVVETIEGLYLETNEGSGDYRRVDENFAVVEWHQDSRYLLSESLKLFKREKAADKWVARHQTGNLVVRTVRYMRAA